MRTKNRAKREEGASNSPSNRLDAWPPERRFEKRLENLRKAARLEDRCALFVSQPHPHNHPVKGGVVLRLGERRANNRTEKFKERQGGQTRKRGWEIEEGNGKR